MPTSALLLSLAAALVHAGWNLLLSEADDTHAATAVAVVVGVVAFAPVAALTWRLHVDALPYIAASSALETVYLVFLATAYTVAAMSFVYPVARGTAPVLVLAAGALALGGRVSGAAAVGVVIVAGGIVLVRGVRASSRPRDLVLALAVGACIAGYTLVDKRGIEHGSPISYLEVVFAIAGAAYVLVVVRLRGRAAIRAEVRPGTVVAGLGFFGAYALTLAALRLAPAASVAAVRESGVVIATALLALSGRERVSAERALGAIAVVGGIALISLG